LAYARQAADEMPAARLEVLPGTGHLSYLEDPEAFNGVLGRWIQATYEK
jgi:pimeloyl-ACP methyl ester carboxylesterase